MITLWCSLEKLERDEMFVGDLHRDHAQTINEDAGELDTLYECGIDIQGNVGDTQSSYDHE